MQVWDGLSGEEELSLQHKHIVKSVFFSNDSAALATARCDLHCFAGLTLMNESLQLDLKHYGTSCSLSTLNCALNYYYNIPRGGLLYHTCRCSHLRCWLEETVASPRLSPSRR